MPCISDCLWVELSDVAVALVDAALGIGNDSATPELEAVVAGVAPRD